MITAKISKQGKNLFVRIPDEDMNQFEHRETVEIRKIESKKEESDINDKELYPHKRKET